MDTSRLSISRLELSSLLGRADAPLILDVRRSPRFASSEYIVATAAHCPPEDLPRLIASMRPASAVVYCVHGHEVSQEAAQLLRQAGWNARFLEGGIEGGEDGVDSPQDIQRWRAEPLPTARKSEVRSWTLRRVEGGQA